MVLVNKRIAAAMELWGEGCRKGGLRDNRLWSGFVLAAQNDCLWPAMLDTDCTSALLYNLQTRGGGAGESREERGGGGGEKRGKRETRTQTHAHTRPVCTRTYSYIHGSKYAHRERESEREREREGGGAGEEKWGRGVSGSPLFTVAGVEQCCHFRTGQG